MKKLFLIFLYFCTSFSGFSQTLHAIIFADTFDAMIGESVLQDYERMTIETTNIAAALGYQQKTYFYRDYDYNIDKLKEALKSMQCNANDIVIFYASSHGGRAADDNNRFPRIVLENNLIAITEIDEIIAQKNPKFRIVIADCCNSIIQGFSAKELSGGSSKISQTVAINYKTLFAQKGNILIASSSPTEPSAAMADGGVFTTCFLKELGNTVAGMSGTVTWNDIFEKAKRNTKQKAGHTPIADINVQTTQAIAPSPNIAVVQIPEIPQNTADNIENNIINALLSIANPKKDELARIKMVQPLLKKYFANATAKVEIIGKNGVTLVDRKTAEDYIKFLATTKTLLQLVQLKIEKDSQGKIIALQVHEIYKI